MVPADRLHLRLKSRREQAELSQQALAARVGVSRQALNAIEAGRQVPSTLLALHLARALGCTVEDLFRLDDPAEIEVELAGPAPAGTRVALGQVAGRWIAHSRHLDATVAADAIVTRVGPRGRAHVHLLQPPETLERHVLIAGCAPLIGALAERVAARYGDARVRWIPASSGRALTLLDAGHVHVAGLHLGGANEPLDHSAVIRSAFPDRPMLLVNLTRWRQGLVVPAGNPAGLHGGADLVRPGLRIARREPGAGAQALLDKILPGGAELGGPLATDHADVALLVRAGAADVGVAIEGAALAAGLGFVPVAEERFDLAVPAHLVDGAVARVLDALGDPGFHAEIAQLPGYDGALTGQMITLEPA